MVYGVELRVSEAGLFDHFLACFLHFFDLRLCILTPCLLDEVKLTLIFEFGHRCTVE